MTPDTSVGQELADWGSITVTSSNAGTGSNPVVIRIRAYPQDYHWANTPPDVSTPKRNGLTAKSKERYLAHRLVLERVALVHPRSELPKPAPPKPRPRRTCSPSSRWRATP